MTTILNWVTGLINKFTPLKGGRTSLVAILGVVYGVTGLVTAHLTVEQAATVIVGSIGLIFAANHTA
jgi:hypothetical protein